jgi:hypothetical protein
MSAINVHPETVLLLAGAFLMAIPTARSASFYALLFRTRKLGFSVSSMQIALEHSRTELRRHAVTLDLLDYALVLVGSTLIITGHTFQLLLG